MNKAYRAQHTRGAGILLRLLVSAAGLFVLCGCGESDTTGPGGNDAPTVGVGSIQVTTATTGSTPDPDGYAVTVNSGVEQPIGINDQTTLVDLATGDHNVELIGLTSNCTVASPNPQTVTVVAGETSSVSFEVACEFIDLEALGKIAFTRADFSEFTGEIWVMEAHGGNPLPLTDTQDDFDPVWSPDGTKVAFTRGFSSLTGVAGDVWVMDADGSNPEQLTNDPADDLSPAWSPDGTKIAFASVRDGNSEIYVMDADGSNPVNLTNNPVNDYGPAWSPDGAKIAFTRAERGFFDDVVGEIYVMEADGSSPMNLTNSAADDFSAAWSPDGTKVAFGTDRDGDFEIYVMNADGSNPVRLTNDPADDFDPAWSPDGTKIAFAAERDGPLGSAEVYVMNADGSNPARLTNDPANDVNPAFALSP